MDRDVVGVVWLVGLCIWKCAVAPVSTMEEFVAANIDALLMELI